MNCPNCSRKIIEKIGDRIRCGVCGWFEWNADGTYSVAEAPPKPQPEPQPESEPEPDKKDTKPLSRAAGQGQGAADDGADDGAVKDDTPPPAIPADKSNKGTSVTFTFEGE